MCMKNLDSFINNRVKISDYIKSDSVLSEDKDDKPSFSVIVPCYNTGETIERTITSIVNQTLNNIEIIIVNDASTDVSTIEKLKELELYVKVINLVKNKGLANARNVGIENSRSDYILCLDSDDFIDESYLQIAKDIFDTEKNISVVIPAVQTFGEQSIGWIPESAFSKEEILATNRVVVASCVRRKIYEEVGYYDTSLKSYEDWEMWIRIFAYKKRNFKVIERKVFFYNIRSESMYHSMKKKTATKKKTNGGLTKKQKTLPASLQKKILKAKKKK